MEGNDKECPAGVSRFKQGKKVETLCCALLSMSFVFQNSENCLLDFGILATPSDGDSQRTR